MFNALGVFSMLFFNARGVDALHLNNLRPTAVTRCLHVDHPPRLLLGEREARVAVEAQLADKAREAADQALGTHGHLQGFHLEPWIAHHARTGAVCAADKARRAAARQLLEEDDQQRAHAWATLERQLTGQWSLWAPAEGPSPPAHFMLDSHEDSLQRRMRLKRNHHFVMYDAPPAVKTPRRGVEEDPEAVAEELGALLKGMH